MAISAPKIKINKFNVSLVSTYFSKEFISSRIFDFELVSKSSIGIIRPIPNNSSAVVDNKKNTKIIDFFLKSGGRLLRINKKFCITLNYNLISTSY